MQMRWAVVVAAFFLAGCADGGGNETDDPGAERAGGHGMHNAATHIVAPNATLGDHWTWTSPQLGAPYTSVIAADQGADWLMATNDPTLAFFDARFDIASLGAVRKSDLAGSQGSTRVEFFKFPLTKDLNWTTTWDQQPLRMQVLDVKDGVAQIEARRDDDTLYAAYTYKASHGYFGQIAYYDANGTTVQFEATVTAAGKGFTGDLVRWTFTTPFAFDGPLTQTNFAQNFPVPLDATDVYIDFVLACTTGSFSGGVAPLPVVGSLAGLDNRGYGAEGGPCPQTDAFSGSIGSPRELAPGAGPEQWGFSAFADPTSQGHLVLNIFVRTLETFQVASA